jgi:outer membrane protein assembly factor BamB
MFPGGFGAAALPGVVCMDLRTGEEMWKNESMPQISRGQVVNFEGENQYGAIAYLWATSGNKWQMYDAFTGRLISTIENATSGTFVYGPKGELLVYILDGAKNQLLLWNSTLTFVKGLTSWAAGAWRPTATVDWSKGLQWNVSIPDVPGVQGLRFIDYKAGVIVAESTEDAPTFVHVGYDTVTGQQLWVQNRTDYGYGFSGSGMAGLISGMSKTINEGVYVFYEKETLEWHAFNAKTGTKIWTTEPMNTFTGTDYSMYDWAAKIAYGKLYVTGYSGHVVAFDLTDGTHLWTYSQGSSGMQTPYGSWPVLDGLTVADGKLYVPTVEHTPYTPMMRGYTLFCIDAETGTFLWKIPGFPQSLALADGYLVAENGYDNLIYCFGKGQSETTVSATVGGGRAITIQGTVTDQSPGQTGIGVPAAGTPAIADEHMDAWMKYLYMQEPMPTNATGVTVNIFISDQNGNMVHNIQAISDISGHYAISWVPTNNGLYTVTAAFDGTKSYYASTAVTSIAIDTESAAEPTSTPQTTPASTITSAITPTIPTSPSSAPLAPREGIPTETFLIIAATAIVIGIASLIALMLRRRQ